VASFVSKISSRRFRNICRLNLLDGEGDLGLLGKVDRPVENLMSLLNSHDYVIVGSSNGGGSRFWPCRVELQSGVVFRLPGEHSIFHDRNPTCVNFKG